jgi:hypothetical protein
MMTGLRVIIHNGTGNLIWENGWCFYFRIEGFDISLNSYCFTNGRDETYFSHFEASGTSDDSIPHSANIQISANKGATIYRGSAHYNSSNIHSMQTRNGDVIHFLNLFVTRPVSSYQATARIDRTERSFSGGVGLGNNPNLPIPIIANGSINTQGPTTLRSEESVRTTYQLLNQLQVTVN